ncbi:hypothetical protein WG66_011261 [Moniliophthora roreri]|nr:hypothetical protein WG66_011261 [Moniliophthora roreri]
MSDAETPNTKSGNKKDPEPLPDPPFKVEYASSGRAKCKGTVIEKDALRLGTAKPFRGICAYEFKHWGCVTPEDIKAIHEHESESGVKITGMDDLRTEDQERAKKALKKGHVDEKDAQAQKAKSDIARVKEAEKEKEKKEEKKRKSENADTDGEPKTKKKKTKNSEDSEKPKETKEKKPKKKEEKEKHVAPRTKEEKKTQKPAPASSQPDEEIVPDSEEEADHEKHKAEEKKSPKKDKDRRLSKNKDSSMTSIDWPPTPPRSDKDAKEKGKEKKKSPKKQKSPKKKAANDEDDQMDIDEVSKLVTQASIDKLLDDKPKKPEKKAEMSDSDSENEALVSKKPTKKLEVADNAKEDPKAKTTPKKASTTKGTAKPKTAPQEKVKAKLAPRKSTSMATSIPGARTSTSVPPTPTHNSANPVFVDLSGIAPFLRSPHHQLPNPTRLPPPKVPLSEFCKKYELSDALQEKLKGLNIDGPHVLRLIKDEALEKKGLSIGEVAGLRDAEERWMTDHAT